GRWVRAGRGAAIRDRRGRPAARGTGEVRIRGATYAVYTVFIANGFIFASWAARIPQVRDGLRVSPGVLGLILLCIAAGSTIATPLAGLVMTRLGDSRTVAVMSLIAAGGMASAAVGSAYGIPPVAAGLAVFGFSTGTWDVAMNVQGAAVEQARRRAIMSRFHAGWSIGTGAGAGPGAHVRFPRGVEHRRGGGGGPRGGHGRPRRPRHGAPARGRARGRRRRAHRRPPFPPLRPRQRGAPGR